MTVSHCNVLEIKRGRGGLTYSRGTHLLLYYTSACVDVILHGLNADAEIHRLSSPPAAVVSPCMMYRVTHQVVQPPVDSDFKVAF